MRPARLLLFAPAALVLAVGCLGDIRRTTTPRTSHEMLLLSTAAERAVAKIDTRVFVGKKVHLDLSLLATYDRSYVWDALEQRVLEAGGTRAGGAGGADVVVEVRSAVLALDDRSWSLIVPLPPIPPGLETGEMPAELGLSFKKQSGWARLQAYAYDPKTQAVLASWRDLWGHSHDGYIVDDILPDSSVTQKATDFVK